MLNEFKISLNSIEKVKEFTRIVSRIKPDLDIIVGRYVIDAKSIMGIFSIDLTKNLILRIGSDDYKECADIYEQLKRFAVEEGTNE